MAIVTFSPQTDMIREVLRERFGTDLAMQVRGGFVVWLFPPHVHPYTTHRHTHVGWGRARMALSRL